MQMTISVCLAVPRYKSVLKKPTIWRLTQYEVTRSRDVKIDGFIEMTMVMRKNFLYFVLCFTMKGYIAQ